MSKSRCLLPSFQLDIGPPKFIDPLWHANSNFENFCRFTKGNLVAWTNQSAEHNTLEWHLLLQTLSQLICLQVGLLKQRSVINFLSSFFPVTWQLFLNLQEKSWNLCRQPK